MIDENDALPRHLSASDSVAWRIEANPLLRSTITLVLVLDQTTNHRALRTTIEAASVAFPRLRQRVVGVPLRASTPVWANDPHFDLDYHVRWIRAGENRTHRDVLNLAATLAMQGFDRTRPLWEWTIVDDLEDGRSAMIIKMHHSVTDGVGGIRLMSQLFDLERNDGPVRRMNPDDVPQGETPGALALILEAVQHEATLAAGHVRTTAGHVAGSVRHPLAAGQTIAHGLASTARLLAPASAPLSPLMTERSPRNHFEEFDVPLADLKAAARRIDGKLNDAFMTAVAIGLRLYHEAHGESVDALRVNMPINLRTDSSVGGNNWAPARFLVPLGGADVDEHMRSVHDIVGAQRAEPALEFAGSIAAVLDQLPTPVLTQIFTGMLTCLDFAATNVPGVPIPLYLAGAQVEAMQTFAPPSGAAVNFALLSYRETASVGINIDPEAIPDPAVLVRCVRNGFDAVISPPKTVAKTGHRRPRTTGTPAART